MRKIILISALIFVSRNLFAQELFFSSGLSIHSHKKLKKFQENVINNAVVRLKSTQSFPAYLQYGFIVRTKVIENLKIGLQIYQTSTAARSSYEDYSGKIEVDQLLKCFGTSAHVSLSAYEAEKGKLNVYINLGLDISKLNFKVNTRVFNDVDKSNDNFQAISPTVQLGLEYQYFFSRRIFLNINSGYHGSQPKMLKSRTNNLEYESVNWSGFKLMGGLGIFISR